MKGEVENDPGIFACTGQSGLTPDGERAYVVAAQSLRKIEAHAGISVALDAALGLIRASADFAHTEVSPLVANQLLQTEATLKWLASVAEKKARAA